jgi:hypothetical protein
MKRTWIAIAIALLVLAQGTHAAAQSVQGQEVPIKRSHNPRLVGTALLINLVYVPVHLGITCFGAILGGLTGFITLGDVAAAESMWGLTDGSSVVTPEMLEGTEEFRFTAYD